MNKKITYLIALIVILGSSKNLLSQVDFYDLDSVQEIRMYFSESNWDEILDSLYVLDENERLLCDVTINGMSFPNSGVRYKGFSSYSQTRAKNPFNISLDHTDADQHYQGFNKIKLSNVIQDPSFVREVLSYEIARKYMPASRANYANVYVNDTLIGLYSNIEAVNKDFLEEHFGSRGNTFVKCNPESLDLNGENSNLSDTQGTDVANYYPFYKMESDNVDDWTTLQNFITTLNQDPTNIESVLNVDRALWMHAFNYSLINFDSYVGYAQNYYVYQHDNGQFNPILWDLNMSFASYRLTDASDNWDGFTIEEAKEIDPLQHINSVSVQPRPFLRNLLSNDTYKRMYLAHMRTIIEENFSNSDYFGRAQAMQGIISADVIADTNKFYTDADFTANLTSTVSDLVDYPGLTELMDDRAIYLMNYTGFQGAPTIYQINTVPALVTSGEDITITARVEDASLNVLLAYRFAESEVFAVVPMFDDGLNDDGAANDSIYGAPIDNIANVLHYYIYAENDSSGRFSPERAAYEYHTLEIPVGYEELVINEVMAVNEFIQTDPSGQYDDWIELHNTTSYKISTTGMYLSNYQGQVTKWEIPSVVINPGDYLIVWADEDTTQFGLHANFKLDSEGDSLWLRYADGTIIDSMSYGVQYPISTVGRFPNGTGNFVEMKPTYDTYNIEPDAEFLTEDVFVYPNPATDAINIKVNQHEPIRYAIYALDGRQVTYEIESAGQGLITIDTHDFFDGLYLLQMKFGENEITKKIMIKR